MRGLALCAVAACGSIAASSAGATAARPGGPGMEAPAAPTEVLVRFASDVNARERVATRQRADVEFERRLSPSGLEVADPDPGVSVTDAVAALERSDRVLYAEPNAPRRAYRAPDDPLYRFQWALENTGQSVNGQTGSPDADIDGPDAWDTTTGAADVAVAVVDTGLDLDHPDIAPNLWVDRAEAPGNAIDDDANGFVDDVHGWDFVAHDAQPLDENGHGTHVAGTIAARGNDGWGVSGVAWRAGLLPLRALGADGTGRVADVLSAYAYAVAAGARIVNASLGGSTPSRAERDLIGAATTTLFVVAAGNEGADNDASPSYPCDYDLPNVVCVAASDRDDRLAAFSNFGRTSVDLAAPGVDIASSWPGERHALLSGTSMAAPHVAGAAALALSVKTDLTPRALGELLRSTADRSASLSGRVSSGGRLNVERLLAAVKPADAVAPPAPAPSGGAEAGSAPPGRDTAAPPVVPAAPAQAADRLPPGLSLALSAPRSIRAAIASGLRVRVRCSEACRVLLEARAASASTKRAGLPAVVGARAVDLPAASAVTRRVPLDARSEPRLRRLSIVALRVNAVATDRLGNRRVRATRSALVRRW
ncbi:MAG TPA: S8 family peptidase [Solirubrobacteraceae bacterium]